MNLFKLSVILFFLVITACSGDEEQRYLEIYGEWEAADWLVEGRSGARNINNVTFRFNEDRTYSSQLGSQSESGTYRIRNNHLYTTAENRLEIMTRITTLNSDSLVLDMNNAGVEETIVLLKKQ